VIPSLGHQLVALALCGGEILVRAIRIRLLVPTGGLSLWQAVTINAYGDAASALTPGRLGGDPARFVGFRRATVSTPEALAGLAVESLIDWILLGLATLVLSLALAGTATEGARRLVVLATSPNARVFVALVLVLIVLCAVVAWRYHRRAPTGTSMTLALAWRRARALGWRPVALAAGLTTLSMAARTAILPVLVAGLPGIAPGAVVLGSFALLFGQLALPTPAGAGGVELAFIGGFAGTLRARDLAVLLLAWRTYTLILGAALGVVLFGRGSLASWSTRRRYSAKSSVNVRSQL
jgi:lysylphosphatidylglycerol synthase-like protein